LVEERQQHEKTRQQYELTLAAAEDNYLNALKQVEQDQLVARATLETQLREEKDGALSAVSDEWKEQLKDLRHEHAHSLALLYHEVRELQVSHRQELARRDAEQQIAHRSGAEALMAAHAEADRQQELLRRQHEEDLAETLAREADSHRQREQQLAVEWDVRRDELQRRHAEALTALD